jgi:nucleotide-binding universal stress UspA family protein
MTNCAKMPSGMWNISQRDSLNSLSSSELPLPQLAHGLLLVDQARKESTKMKILIAYDGSSCADLALEDLRRAGLPRLAEAAVLSVAELWMPVLESVGAGEMRIVGALPISLEKAESLARRACERVQSYFPEWTLKAEARSGAPASVLIEKADEWRPDLIVVGSHDRSALGRFMLGSVSQKVATEAHCSVRVRAATNQMLKPRRVYSSGWTARLTLKRRLQRWRRALGPPTARRAWSSPLMM